MAGFDFSGLGRAKRTSDECYVNMPHANIIQYFNTYRSRLTPAPDGVVNETTVSVFIKKANGSIRKIGLLDPTDEILFGLPIQITDEDQSVEISS